MSDEPPEEHQPTSDQPDQGEFATTWSRFVRAARRLLAGVPQERLLDPYLPLKDAALDAAESRRVVAALQRAWEQRHETVDKPGESEPVVTHLLLLEVRAFPAAVELAQIEEKTGEERRSIVKRLLGLGKTTVDSVREILDDLPPLAKGALTVLGEVFDLFRGD